MWLITYLNRSREDKHLVDGLPQNAVIDVHPSEWMVREHDRQLAAAKAWEPGKLSPIERVLLFAIPVPRSARAAVRAAVHTPDAV